MSAKILLALALVCFSGVLCDDQYIQESQQACELTKDFISCAKVRVLRSISSYAVPVETNATSPLKLVKVGGEEASENEKVFQARFMGEDSEPTKFIKFVQRQANNFLSHQGLFVEVPEGARLIEADSGNDLIEESRKKHFGKKKAGMLIPILILFKLFKVKVLVALALAGIFFIKKVILVSALILPSILHGLKTACKHNIIPHHVEHDHHDGHDGGYGFGGGYGGYGGHEHGPSQGWERNHYQKYNTVGQS